MKREVGLWIDHRQAVIVILTDEGEETRLIKSNTKKLTRFHGASDQESSAEDMRDRQYADHLSQYYDGVIACIRDAESIQIFGPGEAKGELEKRLKSKGLGGHIVCIETVDKMTDRQIAAKVRQHFLKKQA